MPVRLVRIYAIRPNGRRQQNRHLPLIGLYRGVSHSQLAFCKLHTFMVVVFATAAEFVYRRILAA
jgi:hypothetical protein